MSEENIKVLVKEPEPKPTVKILAWAIVEAVVVTILTCVVLGAIAMVAWNALTSVTELPNLNLREAAAAVLLLRVAILTAKV